jgi:hypothetical protein
LNYSRLRHTDKNNNTKATAKTANPTVVSTGKTRDPTTNNIKAIIAKIRVIQKIGFVGGERFI